MKGLNTDVWTSNFCKNDTKIVSYLSKICKIENIIDYYFTMILSHKK